MVRHVLSGNNNARSRCTPAPYTESHGFVVRESCYPFYKPSYTEPSHGCSQEIQSVKKR